MEEDMRRVLGSHLLKTILPAIVLVYATAASAAAPLQGTFRGTFLCGTTGWNTTSNFIVDSSNRVRLVEAQNSGGNRGFIAEYFGNYNPTTRAFFLPTVRVIFANFTPSNSPVTGTVSAGGQTVRYRYVAIPGLCEVVVAQRLRAR
jgi:hypothetical protein